MCSASRSQFLTGRYSYHMGYGELNVFDIEKIGAVPQGSPTIAEYLKYFADYKTYGIGKWHLGTPTYSSLASRYVINSLASLKNNPNIFFVCFWYE